VKVQELAYFNSRLRKAGTARRTDSIFRASNVMKPEGKTDSAYLLQGDKQS